MRTLALGIALLSVITTTHAFIDLFDIGLVNAERQPITVIAEYSNGRKIDIRLRSGESLLTGRRFGEHIARITVRSSAEAPRTFDLPQLRQHAPKTRGEWLWINGRQTHFISSEEKHKLAAREKT